MIPLVWLTLLAATPGPESQDKEAAPSIVPDRGSETERIKSPPAGARRPVRG